MKILGLCLVLTFALLPCALAQASRPPSGNDHAAIQDSPANAREPFGFRVEPDPAPPANSEVFCAYLQTYRVRREYRGSDVVSPADYTICVPTQRFELRSAVQTNWEPAPRQ